MLHHVSLEVVPDDAPRVVELFHALGFESVEAPEVFGGAVDWLESNGTQIHLIKTDEATVPQLGHAAVVPPDFDAALAALEAAGFEVEEHRELWGERRSFALGPAGLRVELMAAPPAPSVGSAAAANPARSEERRP